MTCEWCQKTVEKLVPLQVRGAGTATHNKQKIFKAQRFVNVCQPCEKRLKK